jgi:flagellar biosynthetic protein FliR
VNFDPTHWMLVFVRISAMMAVFPLFSMANFPAPLRAALSGLLAFLIAPVAAPFPSAPHDVLGWIGVVAVEGAIGLLLGFVTRLLFYALEFAGGIIATEIGLNMAASFNPFSSTRSEVPGVMLFYLGGILFLTLDMHHWLIAGLERTYALLPIGGAHLRDTLFHDVVGRTGQLFLIGLLVAAPILAVTFLVNLVFAVLGRAVPQMNVFSESLAFRILTGMAVFGLTLNLTAQHMVNHLRRLPEDFLRVAQLLGGG